MTQIELRNINKHFGAFHVINNVNLTVQDREFVVFLGQSGCGKTTTLRAIAGLETIDSGEILIDGVPVQDTKAETRDIAFVFQSFALYPHLTVYENMAFPLRAVGTAKAEVDQTVRRVAGVLQIGDLLKRRPSALSGGDLQRVAIGRALVRNPKAMLMDEPIGSLDAKLREEMRVELKRLHVEQGSTTIYVTHDQIEAMALADRIVVMHAGVLQQVGVPEEVYAKPANLFVAQFVGSPVMNVAEVAVSAVADGARVVLAGTEAGFEFPAALVGQLQAAGGAGRALTLGIRPEALDLALTPTIGHVEAEVHSIEPLGSHDIVDLRLGSQTLRARTRSGVLSGPGRPVFVRADPARAHFFDTETGRSLGISL
ncbi:MAG: ABC transporter ATP-binding protein [Paracoccaceae bacterium]